MGIVNYSILYLCMVHVAMKRTLHHKVEVHNDLLVFWDDHSSLDRMQTLYQRIPAREFVHIVHKNTYIHYCIHTLPVHGRVGVFLIVCFPHWSDVQTIVDRN